jgi:hypothetical protein
LGDYAPLCEEERHVRISKFIAQWTSLGLPSARLRNQTLPTSTIVAVEVQPVLEKRLITAYGLRWNLVATEWLLSPTNRRLLGIRAEEVADFYNMPGFYVLYFEHEPVYFGIARKRGLGERIREHLQRRDRLKGKWDAFSWFAHGTLALDRRGVLSAPHGGCEKDALPPILH